MTYTPASKAFADRLILDYTVMRASGSRESMEAAQWWLAGKIAELHTRARINDAPICALCQHPIMPNDKAYHDVHFICKFGDSGP